MPRCCAMIYDPKNTSSVVVYCEVNAPDEESGLGAAREAAEAAFAAVHPGTEPAATTAFTLPGRLTHAMVELGS